MVRIVECPACGYWSGVEEDSAPIGNGKTFQELVSKYQEGLLTRNWNEGPFSGASFRKRRSNL